MAATLGLVLDCADPDKLAEFWSAAIGYTTLGGAGSYVLLVDADGKQPKLLLQRVDEPKSGKNRMRSCRRASSVQPMHCWCRRSHPPCRHGPSNNSSASSPDGSRRRQASFRSSRSLIGASANTARSWLR